ARRGEEVSRRVPEERRQSRAGREKTVGAHSVRPTSTLRCSRCDRTYAIDGLYNLCPNCSAPLLVEYEFHETPSLRARCDMWRYVDVLPVDSESEIVTL